ncbi:MAG: thiamine-phosphate kinase [Cyclobacteriaceae bacterium]
MSDQEGNSAKNPGRTELQDLWEFGLIDRIKGNFKLNQTSSVLGIDDDAAVIDIGDAYLLIATDMLLEGVHFDLSYVPIHHLGYKAVAVNVSDIAAMNGVAEQITVNIGLSNRFSLEAVDALYEGIKYACKQYNVDLVGGDTTASHSGLVLSITAVGRTNKNDLVKRQGAQPNDLLVVSGNLGAAYLGLQVLEREKQTFLSNPEMQPKLDAYDYLVQRQLKSEARTDVIEALKEAKILPTAMIDISDGLASEVLHICKNSGVGAAIHEEKLPIDSLTIETAAEFNIDATTCALNGGEDYELLFAISQNDFEKLEKINDVEVIGYITDADQGAKLITKGNNLVPLTAQGWKHFD